jgi:hypothetical protein
MDWLIQNLFSAFVWELLLLVGVGAALGYLRAKWPAIASPVLYGIGGATCVGVLIFTFTGHGFLSKQRPEVTPENLETNVRKWADDLGLGVTRMQAAPNQDVYFGLVVTLADGNPLMVFRGKEKSGFLQMECALVLSQEHLAMLSKLSKEQADDAMQEIVLEMARSRIGYVMQTSVASPPLNGQMTTTKPAIFQQTIIVVKPLAITGDLSEASFGERINELDSEIVLVRATTNLTLERYSRQAVTPRVVRQ